MSSLRTFGLALLTSSSALSMACVTTGASSDNAAAGAAGAAGSTASGGAAGGSSGSIVTASELPTPPGAADVPRPSGTPGNLKVLDWAGFKSALTYTFDDGQPSQVEHYQELQATGVHLTFFLNSTSTWGSGFSETFSQAVRDGHELGNHTAHHCNADADGTLYSSDSSGNRQACPGASMAAEYDDCTKLITSTLGAPHVWTTASPFGAAGYKAPAAERFFLNRGVMGGSVAANGSTDPFDLPIWGPAENDTVDKFNASIDGAHSAGRWLIMLLHSIGPTENRWYATVDIAAITGSISHAKSLGDVWIDTMADVGAYWRGQKVLSSVSPTTSGNAQTWTWTLPDHFPSGKYLRVTVDGGTLSQKGQALTWNAHGYYEIALDAGALTLAP